MGREVAVIAQDDVPSFLCEVARTVTDSGMNYDQWVEKNPKGVETIADKW